jgi:excisionase family DNA binding protein
MADKEKNGPKWFSIKEAAKYLNIGEPTLYRWMRDRKITYRKVGDSTRFLQADLDSVVQVFHSDNASEAVKKICPVCHGDELYEGRIRSTGLIHFQLRSPKFWTLKDSNLKMSAVACARCGAVTLLGDVEKLNKIKKEQQIQQANLD